MGVNGIYGLSGSGLDIESMVKVGMMSKQNEYDKMAQKYTKNEWTKNALIEINNQITTFNMSSLSDYKLASKMNAKTATSSDETAVKVTANAAAVLMEHRVDVDKLSTNAYLISNKTISAINHNSNEENKAKNYLSDVMFTGLSNSTWVTSSYNTAQQRDGDTITYTGDSTDKVITKTAVTRDSENNITEFKYTSTSGSERTYTFSSNTVSEKKITATYDTSSTSSNITSTALYQLDTNGGQVLYENNNPIQIGTATTFTLNDLNFTLTEYTDDRDPATSVEFNAYGTGTITTNSDGTRTITFSGTNAPEITLNSSGTEATVTYTDTSNTLNPDTSGATKTVIDTTYADGKGSKHEVTEGSVTTSTTTLYNTSDNTKLVSEDDGSKITTVISRYYGEGSSNNWNMVTLTEERDGTNWKGTTKITETGISGTMKNGSASLNSDDFRNGRATSNLSMSETAISFTIGDGKGHETEEIKYSYDDLINGEKTINDLISDINSAATSANVNVRAQYDNISGRFFLYNTESGAKDKVEINALDSSKATNGNSYTQQSTIDFFDALQLSKSSGGTLNLNDENNQRVFNFVDGKAEVSGSYGSVRIDGVTYNEVEGNKITVFGVSYEFTNTTTEGAQFDDQNQLVSSTAQNPVTVTANQDTDAIIDRVKSFVESYNKILSSLYEKYDEKSDSNYKPLTQAQKDQMKDEQVEKWEEKAKQGLLYHDQTLSKIITQMRNAVTASVEVDGKSYSIFGLGISTTGIKGQLVLDETKLKNALDEDGEAVYNVFGKLTLTKDSTGKEVTDYDKSGVAQRLGDIFTDANKLIKNRAGSSADIAEDSDLNSLLRELQTKMSNFKKLMDAFEDRLYKKYDAMEVTLSKLGTQLNFITGGQ